METSDKYIYALFNNQKRSEYWDNPISTSIRIFDWNGDPQASIKVPDYLTFFTVDEKSGTIIGVSLPEEKIIKYNIKKILNEL
jgi:hypothetical protein